MKLESKIMLLITRKPDLLLAFNSPPSEKAAEADLTPSGFDDGSVVSPIASVGVDLSGV